MHGNVRNWVIANRDDRATVVVECGGRDINGGVRDLFDRAVFIGVDLLPGPGVDIVADFVDFEPLAPADVVLCLEVAEHCPTWPALIAHAAAILRPGGRFIFTAAGPGRSPHSAIIEGPLQPGEHYANIHPLDLAEVLDEHFAWREVDILGADIRAVAHT